MGVEARKIGGGWPGHRAVWRPGVRTAAGVACLLFLATPSASGTPKPVEQVPVGPPASQAAPAFDRLPAERPSPFSTELEARLSAGAPAVGEGLPQAPRPEAPRPEAPPPEPVVDLVALRGDLEGAVERHAGRYGVVVFDPNSGGGVSLGGKEDFTAASVGKLPTLLALYRAAAWGELDLDEKISILPGDYRSYGTGVLHNHAPGTEMTLRECAYYLVNKSDNTAWAMLDRRLGVEGIQAEMEEIGARGTDYGKGVTTPGDVFLMLRKISDPAFTDGKLSAEMISAMTDTAFEDRIPASLPPGVRVAHKIGSYEDSYGDAGIVFYKDRDGTEHRYFVVVLSGETAEGSARAAMQEVSRVAYEALAAPRQDARTPEKKPEA